MFQMRGFFHRFGSATEVLRSAGRTRGRAALRAGASGRTLIEPLEERRLLTSTIEFDAVTAIGLTVDSWGLTSADFNNDTHLDLAAVAAGGNVEVLLNDGSGVFTSAGNFTAGVLAQDVEAGDFDGDGNQDLAVVNQFGDSVSILLGAGDGTFAAAVDYPVIANVTSISIADATGDGVLDFAVNSGASGFLLILPGNGDGTFGASIPINNGLNVSDVQLADLDGENGADLIYTVVSDESVRVRLNQGGGTFGAEQTFSTGSDPQDIAAVDLDLDGDLDLAVANTGIAGGGALTVLLNDGTGTLALVGNTDLAASATSLQAADLNGDLLPDLAVMLSSGQAVALAGDGSGTFTADVTVAPVAGSPSRLALGDFDGDGDVDLVSADSQAHGLSFHANITPAPPTAPDAPDLDAASDLGANDDDDITSANTDLQFTITGVTDGDTVRLYLGATVIGEATAVGDSASIVTNIGVFADGVYQVRAAYNDGVEDSARSDPFTFTIDTTVPAFTSTPTLSVPIGPTYTYDAETNEEGDTGLTYALTTGPTGMTIDPDTGVLTWTPALEDFGDNEVVISATDVSGNVGTQEFTLDADTVLAIGAANPAHALPGASWGMTTGDFNEDGFDDVAVTFVLGSVMIFTSNGDGTLTNGDFYNVGTSPRTAYAADLDGDGHIDLATVNFGSDNISVLLGNGDGTFADPVNYDVGSGPVRLTSADLDGMNGEDLIVSNANGNSLSVMLNNGDGTFAAATNVATGANPQGLATGDFDNDGDLDVAVAAAGTTSVYLFANDGDGGLTEALQLTTPPAPSNVALIDIDNDGWLDVAATSALASQGLSIFLNDGEGGFGGVDNVNIGYAANLLTVADMNGDGPLDLLVGESNSFAKTLQNDTLGGFETPYNLNEVTGPLELAAADVDGDGMLDIVALLDTDELVVLFNESTAPPAAPAAPDLPPAFDTGALAYDNVTSVNNAIGEPVNFFINNVLPGATVSLYADGVLLGEAVAVGTYVTVRTDAATIDTVLAEGEHTLRVYQTWYSTSVASLPLELTVDTIEPTITTLPTRFASVGQAYGYDVDADEEGNDGVVYSLATAPAGMDIDPDTGEFIWTPLVADRGTHDVTVRITDLAGNSTDQEFTVTVMNVDTDDLPQLGPDGVIQVITNNFNYVDPDSDQIRFNFSGGDVVLGTLNGEIEFIVAAGDFNNLNIKVKKGLGGDSELHVGSLILDNVGTLNAPDVYIVGGLGVASDGMLRANAIDTLKLGGLSNAAGLEIAQAKTGGMKFQADTIDTTGELTIDGLVDTFKVEELTADLLTFAGGVEKLQAAGDWVTTNGATFGEALPGLDDSGLPDARKLQFKADVDGPLSVLGQDVRKFDVRGDTLENFTLNLTGETRNFRVRGETDGVLTLGDTRKTRVENIVGDVTLGATQNVRFNALEGSLSLGESRKVQSRGVVTGDFSAVSVDRFTANEAITGATFDFTLAPESVNDESLGKLVAKARVTGTTFTSLASVGRMLFRDALVSSNILLGVDGGYDPATGLPADGTEDILVGGTARLDRLTVQATTDFAYRDSIVIAHELGDLDLGRVFLSNNGDIFGLGAAVIDTLSMSWTDASGTFRGEDAFTADDTQNLLDFEVSLLPVAM